MDQNGQLISQRTQIQQVDQNGNLVTRTEDRKPSKTTKQPASQIIATPESTQVNAPVNPQIPNQQLAPSATQVPQNPDVVINPAPQAQNTPLQFPTEILETFKGLQASIQGMQDRLNNIENFKKSAEDEKIKAASEAQRKMIEAVFTPEIVADDNARQQVIDKFVGLPLSDEDLQWILNLVTTGQFSVPEGGAVESASKAKSTKKGSGLKQASLNRLSLQQVPEQYTPITGSAVKRIFGNLDFSHLK